MQTRDSLGRAASMALGVSTAAIIGSFYPVDAQQPLRPSAAGGCRITGRVTSGDQPLPGVSMLIRADDGVKAATSTDLDGRYTIAFAPNGAYRLTAELATFQPLERPVTVGASPCDSTVDVQLMLQPRTAQGSRGSQGAAQGAQANGGRGRGGFQTLNVAPDANGVGADTVAATAATTNADADLQNFLPAGFSLDSAQADAVAINGSSDATSFDRGLMNDRQGAIARGDFAPGAFDGGFPGGDFGGRGFPGGPLGAFADAGGAGGGQNGGPGGRGGPGGPGPGGRGGPGGPGGPGGRGGPGGPGGRGAQNFVLGGRGAQPPRPYQGSVNYTFGGSVLDTPPYQLRPDAPLNDPNYARQNFGVTIGGPIKIPGLYNDKNRRSNFQFNYAGNRSNNIFNQYATVPTAAMRNGDFSATKFPLRNPVTGQPFENNQIPQDMIDSGSALMAQYLPLPNLPGTAQNYHVSKVTQTISDNFNLRVTQNLSRNAAQGGGRGGRGGGGGRGGPGPGGRGGRGARGTTIMLNAQVQYRSGQNDVPNIYDGLGGLSNTSTLTTPIGLNIIRGRTSHSVNVNFTHATTAATNAFTNTQNVAGAAGIQYPDAASLDPLNWGLPTLNITGYTGLRTPAASSRIENRFTTNYSWSRPVRRHQVRIGAEYRHDGTSSETNSNARGTFQFSGLYTADGAQVVGGTGFGYADFLLGLPAQASVQVAGITKLRDRSFSTFIEDNWQKNSRLTFNLGLRYELIRPFTEIDGRMANLDTLPDFSAATTVVAGGVGPYTGAFPTGLVRTDGNNVGPRVGLAYRLAPGTILRGGYGVSFNNQTYSSIARQLVAQPPFSSTQTVIGSPDDPLDLQTALLTSTSTTTNNWGVDKNYTLGTIQTWNATLQRDLNRTWSFTGGYTGTKGTSLDILRAPNRGPNGLLNPDVQAYTWESSGGHSILYSGTFAIRRRPVKGLGGGVSYTLAKSHDNASSLGAGGTVVAQNDKDLDAEWALSSFDRRHAVAADVSWELPFGPNRRWLAKGGFLAGLVGEWQVTANGTFQSGTPFTARVVGAAQDILQGTNNSLRANYTGADIGLSDPSIDQFFNTSAFRVPPFGSFGDSDRNTIIGPGGHQVNASISRNIRMGRQETMTLSVNANNLFNTVQWANIDTNLNSPTYGQVTSVRAMRAITVNVRMRY